MHSKHIKTHQNWGFFFKWPEKEQTDLISLIRDTSCPAAPPPPSSKEWNPPLGSFVGQSTCNSYTTSLGAGQRVLSYTYYTPWQVFPQVSSILQTVLKATKARYSPGGAPLNSVARFQVEVQILVEATCRKKILLVLSGPQEYSLRIEEKPPSTLRSCLADWLQVLSSCTLDGGCLG